MSEIENLVSECESILENGGTDGVQASARRIESALETVVPNIRQGLKMFRTTINGYPQYSGSDAMEDLRRLKSKARVYMEEKQRELELERFRAMSAQTNVNVEQHANSNATSSSSATVEAAFDSAASAVENDGKLTEDEKDALLAYMIRMKKSAELRDQSTFAEKLSKGLDIARKGVDLVPALAIAAGKLAGLF